MRYWIRANYFIRMSPKPFGVITVMSPNFYRFISCCLLSQFKVYLNLTINPFSLSSFLIFCNEKTLPCLTFGGVLMQHLKSLWTNESITFTINDERIFPSINLHQAAISPAPCRTRYYLFDV